MLISGFFGFDQVHLAKPTDHTGPDHRADEGEPKAFKRDQPEADVHFYDTGHFALETHAAEIAAEIRKFLAQR